MFWTDKAAKEEIARLGGVVATHEATIATRDGELSTARERVTELEGTNATLTADLEARTSERDEAIKNLGTSEASLTAANGKLATFDADVDRAAITKIAAIGHAPVAAVGTESKTGKVDTAGLTGHAKVSAAFASAKK